MQTTNVDLGSHYQFEEELAGPPTPVREAERFATLDVLRGTALLGILIINIEGFSGPESLYGIPIGLLKPAFTSWHAHLDAVIVAVKWLFAEGKMRDLFSLLFGAGAILLIERSEQRAGASRAAAIFFRRNLWLMLFGLCHAFLIWYADILFDYAALGLGFLYWMRHFTGRVLLTCGLLVWLIGGTFGFVRISRVHDLLLLDAQVSIAQAAGGAATAEQRALLLENAKQRQTEFAPNMGKIHRGQLGYRSGLRSNAETAAGFLGAIFGSGLVLEQLGAMIVGMGLYKLGYLTNRFPAKTYLWVVFIGYAVSFPLVLIGLWHVADANFSAAAAARWVSKPYTTEVVAATLANTSLILLVVRTGRVPWLLGPLSAVGRMALTNYILTSLLCRTFFSWGPWKMYGQLEFYQEFLVVGVVWTILLLFSSAWLHRFNFGPLEWLWRSLTYCKPQRMMGASSMRAASEHPGPVRP